MVVLAYFRRAFLRRNTSKSLLGICKHLVFSANFVSGPLFTPVLYNILCQLCGEVFLQN